MPRIPPRRVGANGKHVTIVSDRVVVVGEMGRDVRVAQVVAHLFLDFGGDSMSVPTRARQCRGCAVANFARRFEAGLDVAFEVAVLHEDLREFCESGRRFSSHFQEALHVAGDLERRRQVQQFTRCEHTVLARAGQRLLETGSATDRRHLASCEDASGLARFGEALENPAAGRLEERCLGRFALRGLRRASISASRRPRTLAQHGENAFPFKAFEGFLRDEEAHRVLVDSAQTFMNRHRKPKRWRMERNRSTEAVLDATRDLDRRSAAEILAAIHAEDAKAVSAVGEVLPQVEKAVDVLACTLGGGGRWFNVGAGTSGRMGALDSAELPPTFGIEPSRVQAIVAGGARALSRAVEGAEDDVYAGPCELRRRGLGAGDAVVAISASGHTPFVLSCLEEAHAAGARRIAITCNPEFAPCRSRRDRDRYEYERRGDRRLHPNESWARSEDGSPPALDDRHGAVGLCKGQPHDASGARLPEACGNARSGSSNRRPS